MFFKFLSISVTLLNIFLQILSSNEWNVITHILPFIFNSSKASLSALSNTSNSLLTSILIAWNILRAGCFSLLYFSGTALLITSTNSKVVLIGLFSIIFNAILGANFSSPYL